VMPRVSVRYVASSTTGLFEQTGAHYGEIWYQLGDGAPAMGRDTTVDGVLEMIYDLAGVQRPAETSEIFRGHPLAVPPKRAGTVFYGIWPALVIVAGVSMRRRQ
jgi:hypothetical protein